MDMKIDFCGIELKNPVTTAAGTFNGRESVKYYDPALLGAVTTKGVAPVPWQGNPLPRIAETYGGMLNSVGLENPGIDAYIAGELAELKDRGLTVIANVAGHSEDEFAEVCEKLDGTKVDMLEINVSCPNLYAGGAVFGTDAVKVAQLTRRIKKVTRKPVIIKLSPNVTDIVAIAEVAEEAGADALSLINTLVGMKMDIASGRPLLANGTGGLSGPAVKPVALAMVSRVCAHVKLPVIGMGGIMTGEDAYEFLLAGASVVAVGTAALIDPEAPARVVAELEECYARYGNPYKRRFAP